MASSPADRGSQRRQPAEGSASRAESAAPAIPGALLKEARANTKAARGDVAFMASLAREIALTRSSELTLAYRNVVRVMPGFRKRTSGAKTRVTDEVCLVFVVRKKGSVKAGEKQFLPRWLCVYAGQGSSRKIYAVPTDVQDVSHYAGVQPHANSGIWVRNPGWPVENGSFACLATLASGGRSQPCAIGAQHVFTPYPDGASLSVAGQLDVLPLDEAGGEAPSPRMAVTLPYGGVMRSDEREDRPSLDLQLAAIDPQGGLRSRVALRVFNRNQPWVKAMSALLLLDKSNWFYLLPPANNPLAPRRGPVRLTLAAMPAHPYPIPYSFAGDPYAVTHNVFHHDLLCFHAKDSGVPMRGDSGSPIVVRWPDATMTLVGMHIAGDGEGLSWAIPAWQLFDLQFWWQYPNGARVTPLDA